MKKRLFIASCFHVLTAVFILATCHSANTVSNYLPADELEPWAGGAAYYSRWSNGPADSLTSFPVAVWLQSPESSSSANTYREIGINLHIGLWGGPTENQLAALQGLPSQSIAHQNAVGVHSVNNDVITGWLQQDEPDNAQNGTQDPVPPGEIVARYNEMVAEDSTRPVYLNLGQGVASDPWYGRGNRTNHPEDYPLYVQGADIVSFDIYPMNTFPRPESDPPWFKAHDNVVAQNIWYVATGVQRLRQWVNDEKPVWVWIETTNFNGDSRYVMTSNHVQAEVWMAIIHGAMGVGYFCHQFSPGFIEAGLLADDLMTEKVRDINRQIRSLAPVLNSQSVANAVTVSHSSANPEMEIATMVKRYGEDTYIFAVAMRPEETEATFSLQDFTGSQTITVLGEERQLVAQDGVFVDTFPVNGVHIYKVRTGAGSIVDADLDGLPDAWEQRLGLNTLLDDSLEDPDGDELSNFTEFLVGSNPVATCGDLTDDSHVKLDDVIAGLQLLAAGSVKVSLNGDCNGDSRIGQPELISILKKLASP